MRSFVGVLLDFDATVNPEPGVTRAPTGAEQFAALERTVRQMGGTLQVETLVARRGFGLEAEQLALIDEWEADGVALFSLDTLRRGRDIDIDGLRRCFAKGFSLALLVEDLSFTERDEFDRFVELVIAMNEVRRRDHSLEWLEMVNQLAPQ